MKWTPKVGPFSFSGKNWKSKCHVTQNYVSCMLAIYKRNKKKIDAAINVCMFNIWVPVLIWVLLKYSQKKKTDMPQ